jgi:hypothetical protein
LNACQESHRQWVEPFQERSHVCCKWQGYRVMGCPTSLELTSRHIPQVLVMELQI